MKLATLTSAIVLTAATAAFAEGLDANGDGMVTIEETVAMYPDVTPEAFSTADANDDGVLDAEELAAAQEAGLIPNET
ncbi:hypothetical protein [Aliiroseovarius marinus]|uniref:hypothetical protein n=1 Tax=Aliiroseovarius marinus TaxID=2500159 RepID=UPI00249584C3|nr:hypothetical protein [Aliiroseovarius marinus]